MSCNKKKCTYCNKVFPATLEYFHKETKRGVVGLYPKCKICKNARSKKYYHKNKKRLNKDRVQYEKAKYSTDPAYKLKRNLSRRLNHCMRKEGKSILEFMGCSIEETKKHIEKQFTTGMTWDNYGEWHVDHIRPCVSFDFNDEKQVQQCFHYTNLQPLWAKDNISKGAKYDKSQKFITSK